MGDARGRSWGEQMGPYLTLGLQLAITVVVCFFLGRWLDSVFDSAPWLMIAGLALGVTGGFISFFRTAIALGKREDQEAAEKRTKHED
jgi:F0F1-type ATP synthase assembly protein I